MYSDKPQNTIPLKHTASIVEVEIGRPEKREHDGDPQHSAALEISGAILKCCLPEASKPPPQRAGNAEDLEEGLLTGTRRPLRTPFATKFTLKKMLLALIILASIVLLGSILAYSKTTVTPVLGVPFNVQLEWAQYSPYIPHGVYSGPPSGCEITQVNIRHGARFPTSGAAKSIVAAVSKLQAVKAYNDPDFDFLKTFTYDLGTNDLVEFGADQ
ncbi:hypothetical protein EW026_g8445 [Hermanssonia centrifuga]|uniref:Uncharacterized protein n=1 Tax=Hermanssonia centrifuga TaxID=98765 RepID=A0A4S4K5S8_9APHY|nr:hypothetical protein EW026_g8445 [Hermanssonia centrifuga]